MVDMAMDLDTMVDMAMLFMARGRLMLRPSLSTMVELDMDILLTAMAMLSMAREKLKLRPSLSTMVELDMDILLMAMAMLSMAREKPKLMFRPSPSHHSQTFAMALRDMSDKGTCIHLT